MFTCGCSQVLYYVNGRYGAPDIIITENGVDVPNENVTPYSTDDQFRISYIAGYLEQVTCHDMCSDAFTDFVRFYHRQILHGTCAALLRYRLLSWLEL